ncbi:cell division and transport-associated protein TolQ [Desulfobotulus alkaliphilus]|uniref:Cell division and transport-associated protein TolQ n=1 Tax=Desulfobotulus alkaliphilus TaxID=622671 RepID=A0A562RTX7_9BACT|nr:protein TolQ [Desulfobotulus alkaliphilus]TWI71786.1 cell division and transport-associated protein TolQ [Desulfobotulus alkaliphilus]
MAHDSLDLLTVLGSAGIVVKLVLLVLLLFSVVSWAIIFIKFFSLRRDYQESLRFQEFFWKSASLSDVYAKMKHMGESPAARLFRAGYKELNAMGRTGGAQGAATGAAGLGTLKRTLDRTCSAEVTRMGQLVSFLATCGNTAPFIGLLGTVWGIMEAFHGIGLKGSASLAVVAPGISEALVATAIGLGVAIPAVVAYNTFLHRIRTIGSELENFSADFLNIVERDLHRIPGES